MSQIPYTSTDILMKLTHLSVSELDIVLEWINTSAKPKEALREGVMKFSELVKDDKK